MLDHHQLQILSQEISLAIQNGMANGAECIAAALAKPAMPDVAYEKFGVTLHQVMDAARIVVESNTRIEGGGGVTIGRTGRVPVAEQIAAWTVLRKALGMPT